MTEPAMDRPFPREEPPASTREMARSMREIWVALHQEGFTRDEVVSIIGEMLRSTRGTDG